MSIFDKFKDVFKKTKDIAEDKLKDVSEVVSEKAGDLKEVVSEKMEDMQVHEILENVKEKANKTAENLKDVVSEKLDDANAALDNIKAKAEEKTSSFTKKEDYELDTDVEIANVINETTKDTTELVEYDSDKDLLDLLPLEDSTPTTTELTVTTAKQTDEIFDMATGTENKITEVKEDLQDPSAILLEDADELFNKSSKDLNPTDNLETVIELNPDATKKTSDIPLKEDGVMDDHLSALLGESDALDRTIKAAKEIGDMAQKKADILNKSSFEKSFLDEENEEKEDKPTAKKDPDKKSYSDLIDDAKDALFGF